VNRIFKVPQGKLMASSLALLDGLDW
jgi:hypothetical protein